MEEFSASLVREKIIFMDDQVGEEDYDEGRNPTVIRSNRIFIPLGKKGKKEKVVVRAQNMHTALRLAGKVLFTYFRDGLITERTVPMEWDKLWDTVLSNYEKEYNPHIWASIYVDGQPVFNTVESPFVDVIEKCALLTIDNYDATIDVTEDALKKIGHAMHINHSSNVAAVFTDSGASMRCGIIHRSESSDTTFNFTAEGGEMHNRIVQSISMAAAFLEGINLGFIVQRLEGKKSDDTLEPGSFEARQLRGANVRLVGLNKGIRSFEELYTVKYRPEKPKFAG